MRHIKLYEGYLDFVNKGSFNKVLDLDGDWIIKMPLDKKESNYNKSTKEILGDFRRHISFMKKYPDFFVKVKKLDRYRAAIERVDIPAGENERIHVYSILPKKRGRNDSSLVMEDLYQDENYLEALGNYSLAHTDDLVADKWYNFITKLRDKFYPIKLDLHEGNFGIDKNGK